MIQSYQIDLFRLFEIVSGLVLAGRLGRRAWSVFKGLPPKERIVDLPYSQRQLDALVAQYGFSKSAHLYCNYGVFPRQMKQWFAGSYVRMSEQLAQSQASWSRVFAVNYVARYTLEEPTPEVS